MTERFRALRKAEDPLAFFANRQPACPHCGLTVDISRSNLSRLYEEGTHEFDCPHCNEEVTVSVTVSYSFTTDHDH